MGIAFTDIRITPELTTDDVNFLLGNIGDKIVIEIDAEYRNYAICNTSNPMIANYTNGVVGGQWLYDPQGGFTDFQVGDILEHKNYNTNATGSGSPTTVLQKQSDYLIQISTDITGGAGVDIALGTSILNNLTSPTALMYRWNFIENNEALNFLSKVDGQEQRLLGLNLDATNTQTSGSLTVGQKYIILDFNAGDDFTNVGAASNATGVIFTATGTTPTTYTNGSTLSEATDMTFLGQPPYQIGSALVYGTGINTTGYYGFKFTIRHETFITPLFLYNQLTDLQNRIAPSDYLNSNTLKYVLGVTGYYDYNDPNRIVSESFDELEGNVGWFNENFNTGITNYYVDSITYTDSTPTAIPSLALTGDVNNVEIVIKNDTDAPFSNNNTKFTIGFMYLPSDESEYQGNTNVMYKNFVFDRCLQTVGSAGVAGDNLGTGYDVFTDVTATYDSSSQITINAVIEFGADALSYFGSLGTDPANYALFVSVQNHTLDTIDADKVTLLCDVDELYNNATDDGMIVIDNVFLRHFEDNPATEGISTGMEAFPEDDIVAYSVFYVDHNGRTVDQFGNAITIKLTSITAKIKAKNSSTAEEVDLDTFTMNLSGLPYINGDQFVSYKYVANPTLGIPNNPIQRPFHVPESEKRKNIEVVRVTALDTATKSYYRIQFPFIMRWEYFVQLANSSADFFDNSEPFNGFNQDWYRMQTFSNWAIYYDLTITATKTSDSLNQSLTFNYESEIAMEDYDRKAGSYESVSIKSFSYPADVSLYDSVNLKDFILGYDYTLIRATFEKLDSAINLSDVVIRLWIEVYEEGGVTGSRRYSTLWPADSDTWMLSTDGSDMAVLGLNEVPPITLGKDTVTATFLIDHNKIPLNKNVFKISARIYDLDSPDPLARVTEDSHVRDTEDSFDREVEA